MASAWLYTEIVEHVKRDAFKVEIVEFIETIKHDQLLRRVRVLEEVNKATECENGHD
jgi:hypothetical protein